MERLACDETASRCEKRLASLCIGGNHLIVLRLWLRHEFETKFRTKGFCAKVQKDALAGKLKASRLRSVCWKMFLGALSSDDTITGWAAQAAGHRTRYTQLLSDNMQTPTDADVDPSLNNPLSNSDSV